MHRINRTMILLLILLTLFPFFVTHNSVGNGGWCGFGDALQILSKSKLDKCEKSSANDSNNKNDNLNCTRKIIVNMAVPSNSSGGEASMVAEVAEVEENSTNKMQTLRLPPVITVNKSAAYAVLRDDQGHIIEASQPVCCPCGDRRRVPSTCGNFFDKLVKGKANTAHCLRFPGDWYHVFGIGQRTIGFSVRIEVKTGSEVSEVVVGPENRTAVSGNSFLRVNLIGDFGGYTNIPSFEDFYLVIPRQNFSMYMLLERVRFTLDGLECNKIGVGYEAFNSQPDFCTSPYWSCLHNQLLIRIELLGINHRYIGVVGRFDRINEHPVEFRLLYLTFISKLIGAGPRTFSFGISEALNSNLLIELAADDIEYEPWKILGVTVPTFEALAQFGTAAIKTQNIGEVEASYSLTEQFYIMKPKEVVTRSFKIYPTTDQASKYACSAILKDSEFHEVDRAECQFTTTATVLDNGTQGVPFQPPKSGTTGFFETIKNIWNKLWAALLDFITGKTCRSKCTGFFDFHCHIQYVCMSWVIMFGLFLSIIPTVLVLLWLLHQKGFFDPLYDWWEDNCWEGDSRHRNTTRKRIPPDHHHHIHHRKHRAQHHHRPHHHHNMHDAKHRHRKIHGEQDHHHAAHHLNDYNQYLHHVHKNKHKHSKHRSALESKYDDVTRHHRHRKERRDIKRASEFQIYDQEDVHHPYGNEHVIDEITFVSKGE
ncbi:Protein HAPLESS 2 [Bienertia sinuspersici]